ncbi:hypothetical protein LRAMOSA06749 [Lichtheimia ramosa]|uniref:Phospholipid/glycerol acyltransferase domain-containing protein n=1 Tax=Lichtheimia ramosa TaxID=688394 RepID=A0A077WB13_9FUNG|nr:hypothetical protein LRAMOSA06749 [Lichtheimia ramosa]
MPNSEHASSSFAYSAVRSAFKCVANIFFREVQIVGTSQVPKEDPCIFIVGPHANQFVDAGMVLISNPRESVPLMAQSSFKKKVIGDAARMLKAIPVIRPQDLASKGKGTLRAAQGETRVIGTDTSFREQVGSRDLLGISKTFKVEVEQVVSDTELILKKPLDQPLEDNTFKVIPHVDQHVLYDKVHACLAESGCIEIFPEGGSHDQSQMLPLKAGFAIMALGAMAEHPDINVKIVPVGLNYFHPHRFRSRAVISYGAPITVERDWVEKYKQGGPAKREAIAALLDAGYEGLKGVTLNAPSYDTLMIIAAARRLYRPTSSHKLRLDQVVELNRRFLLGYKHFENDPRLIELARKVQAYNNMLKYFGIRDHQVERTGTTRMSAAKLLLYRLIKLICLSALGFPSLLLNAPVILVTALISRRKQRDALAGSNVKIAARDVLATWKVLVVLVFAPIVYGFYSWLLFVYMFYYRYPENSLLQITSWSALSWFAQPLLHLVGVKLMETGMDLYNSLQPLVLAVCNPDAAAQLRTMRERLSDDITTFVNENGPSALEDFDVHKYDNNESPRTETGLFDMTPSVLQEWLKHDRSLFNFNAGSSTSVSTTSNSSQSDEDSS